MERPPKKSTGREVTEAVIAGASGMTPIVGSPVAVAFSFAMGWAYNKRMQSWLDELADAVDELQQAQGLTLEDLIGNELFVDAVVGATRAAQATHQEEKLADLRNAVLNSLGSAPVTADEQARFFRLVDEFTPSHIHLLRFLDDPRAYFQASAVEPPNLIAGGHGSLLETLPEFAGGREWYDLLGADLAAASLANVNLHAMMTEQGLVELADDGLGKTLPCVHLIELCRSRVDAC